MKKPASAGFLFPSTAGMPRMPCMPCMPVAGTTGRPKESPGQHREHVLLPAGARCAGLDLPRGCSGGKPLVRRCCATATRLAAMSRAHWRLAHPDKGLRCFGQLCSCRLNRAERPECRRQSVPTKAESWRVAGRVPVRGRAGLLSQLAFGQGVELEPSRLVPQPGVGIGDTAAGRWKGGC